MNNTIRLDSRQDWWVRFYMHLQTKSGMRSPLHQSDEGMTYFYNELKNTHRGKIKFYPNSNDYFIEFDSEEDAVLFKLRWM